MERKTSDVHSPHEHDARKLDVLAVELNDDGVFPNSRLPLLLYRGAVLITEDDPAQVFEDLFEENGWSESWLNGIYSYHHYHSTAHEVLGIYRGSAKVQLGGDHGGIHEIRAGDVIVIPAGVAHKNLGSSPDFGVVAAYPARQDWDMNYGKPEEKPRADKNIARVALPKMDPVFGESGPLLEKWKV